MYANGFNSIFNMAATKRSGNSIKVRLKQTKGNTATMAAAKLKQQSAKEVDRFSLLIALLSSTLTFRAMESTPRGCSASSAEKEKLIYIIQNFSRQLQKLSKRTCEFTLLYSS